MGLLATYKLHREQSKILKEKHRLEIRQKYERNKALFEELYAKRATQKIKCCVCGWEDYVGRLIFSGAHYLGEPYWIPLYDLKHREVSSVDYMSGLYCPHCKHKLGVGDELLETL